MPFVKTTAEIIVLKAFNEPIDKKWVDWAVDMLRAGYDAENLIILAGEMPPYNQFELARLTDKVFEELGIDYSDPEQVFKNYVCYLVAEVLDNGEDKYKILKKLMNCGDEIGLHFHENFTKFWLLYWAWDDLKYEVYQHYWDGADRSNIDQVITDYFKTWRADNCQATIEKQ